ncbi:MAG TPA: hypothetical protein VFV52_05300 [Bacilli bacterium]|nr:hypothetical protein [Bacilli bacterium]
MRSLLAVVIATALMFGANEWGFWPATPLVGALLVVVTPTTRRAVGLALLSGVIGWGLPLLLMTGDAEIVRLAEVLGGILGIGGQVGTIIALALPSLIGGLLGLSAAWIAGAVKGVVVRPSVQSATEFGRTTLHR